MENLQNKLQKLIKLMGFDDFSISYDADGSRFLIFLNEGEDFKKFLPFFVADLNHLAKLIAKKDKLETVFVDVNNYRRERENLILELARATARKVVATNEEISLPIMNAYERRLVHLELVDRPDISTESTGEGKERRVVIKPI